MITTDWDATTADSTHPWNTYMGDMERSGLDTFSYEDRGLGWQEYTITEAVQGFVQNLSKNYGVMVQVTDSSVYIVGGGGDTVAQLMTYHSATASDTAKQYRPKLTVRYTTDSTGFNKAPISYREKLKARYIGKGKLTLCSPVHGVCAIMDIRGRTLDTFVITQTNQWLIKDVNCAKGIVCIHIQTENSKSLQKVIHIQ